MLEGVFPVWFGDVKGGILERLLRHLPPRAPGRPARLSPLLRRRPAPPLQGARRRGQARRGRQRAGGEPRAPAQLDPPARPAGARRRGVLRAAAGAPPARGDRALPGARPSHRRRRGHAPAHGGGAPLRLRASASPPSAAGAGGRPPPSPICCASTPRSAHRSSSARAPRARFQWPAGFARIPDQDWVQQPLDTFGLRYDTVENHGWYRNLDPTVEDLARHLEDGQLLIDYSGGTGILLDRLNLRIFDRQVGMLIVDSSPKFLRVALDKFGGEERVGLPAPALAQGGAAARAPRRGRWARSCWRARPTSSPPPTRSTSTAELGGHARPRGRACCGRAGAPSCSRATSAIPRPRPSEWILDETVWAIHEVATRPGPQRRALCRLPPAARRRGPHPGAPGVSRSGVPAGPTARALPARPRGGGLHGGGSRGRAPSRPGWTTGSSSSAPTTRRCWAGWAAPPRWTARPPSRRGGGRSAGADPPRDGHALRRPRRVPLLLDLHQRRAAVGADALLGVVEDDAERVALARPNLAHPVPQRDPIPAARSAAPAGGGW